MTLRKIRNGIRKGPHSLLFDDDNNNNNVLFIIFFYFHSKYENRTDVIVSVALSHADTAYFIHFLYTLYVMQIPNK